MRTQTGADHLKLKRYAHSAKRLAKSCVHLRPQESEGEMRVLWI